MRKGLYETCKLMKYLFKLLKHVFKNNLVLNLNGWKSFENNPKTGHPITSTRDKNFKKLRQISGKNPNKT